MYRLRHDMTRYSAASDTDRGGNGETHGEDDVKRRDFLFIATGSFAVIGGTMAVWPLVHQMNPDSSVQALSSLEVDISSLGAGESITVKWRGNPVFIRHRTADEIALAESVAPDDLPDLSARNDNLEFPAEALDSNRVIDNRFIVVMGVCTHLGCVPIGESGEYGGWYCPCHGSHYDTSGRIRKGPAPENLHIPPYRFTDEGKTTVRIG